MAAYLARGMAARGMAVTLLLFTDQGEVDAVIGPLVGADVGVEYLGHARGPRGLDLARGLPALVRALRRIAPDTVIAGANNVALVTAAAMRRARLPEARLFLKTTNPIASSRHRGVIRALRRATYRRAFAQAAGVWTLSPSETDEMRAAFPEYAGRFRDVYNPYVTPAMLARREVAPSGEPRFILAVGRLTRQKRFERLITAFARIADGDVRLRILGEGEDRGSLEALVARLGLQDRVEMPGFVKDVAGAYDRAAMLVLTSDYEGLPAVLLEAMAANCPILSTDCFPAARAILEHAEGCAIIEDTAPGALATLIAEHLEQPRPTGLRAIAERYSIENGVASHVAAMEP